MTTNILTPTLLHRMDAYWRATNFVRQDRSLNG